MGEGVDKSFMYNTQLIFMQFVLIKSCKSF